MVNADGSNEINITDTADEGELEPTWFPDGETVLFSGTAGPNTFHLFTAGVDGSGVVQLTHGADETNQGARASPDGQYIIFARAVGAEAGIRVMEPDGSNDRRITSSGYGAKLRPGG